ARQGANESGVLDIADQKRETGMRLARLRDHAGAEIHADAERRFERGEEVASAASELKHARAFADEELEITQILLVEEGGAREPFPALGRARVGEAADVALARTHAALAAICARVHPHRYTRFSVHLLSVHLPKLQLGANVWPLRASIGGGERAADAFQRLALGGDPVARRDHGRGEHQRRADEVAAEQAPAPAGIDQ